MDVIFYFIGGIIFIITLIISGGAFIRFVKSFKHNYIPLDSPNPYVQWITRFNYKAAPFIISTLGPLGGFLISWTANDHTKHDIFYTPINHDHFLTIFIFYLISLVAFWLSILYKNKMPPLLEVFSLLGMAQGFILCTFLSIHFAHFMLVAFIPMLITFPLICPLLFGMLLFVQIRKHFYGFREKQRDEDPVYDSLILDHAHKFVANDTVNNPFIFFLLLPFIAIQQSVLILFGQVPLSAIKAFTETTTYTFSQYAPPPDLGGHYLCTIASRGSHWLVRPLRKGIRRGKIIDVNRQLLVANAFEEWLEQNTPNFHRFLRKNYNKVGIPLNQMVNNKWMSNLMFIIMKPFECFFLIWLYTFDIAPEKRIQRQYLPKDH